MEIGRERERERREKEKGKLFYVSRCGLRELRGDENGMGEQEGQRQTDGRIEWGRNGTSEECGQVLYPHIAAPDRERERKNTHGKRFYQQRCTSLTTRKLLGALSKSLLVK